MPAPVPTPPDAALPAADVVIKAAVKTWLEEGRAFFEDKARDDAAALAELMSCKTPLELLGVEQRWLMRRSQAYVDAGVRMLAGACLQPEQTAAEAADFRLPE